MLCYVYRYTIPFLSFNATAALTLSHSLSLSLSLYRTFSTTWLNKIGAIMPSVPGTKQQDYAVIFVVGKAT